MSRSVQFEVPKPQPLLRSESALALYRPVEIALAACGVVAAALILLDAGGPVVAPFKFGVCLVLPGWAFARQLAHADPAARLVWTVVSSAVLYSVCAVLLVWSQFWHPRPFAAAALLAASAVVVLVPVDHAVRPYLSACRVASPARRGFTACLPWLILGVGMLLWGSALQMTSKQQLGDLGLLPAFPPTWYLAVGLVTGLCIWGVVARSVASNWILSLSTAGLVLMLYASASLLTTVPRLPWTYKHIAVTDFIGATGRVDPSIDIYNRWPGFFAFSAFVGEVIGFRDALDYAAWAEIGFALIDVVIVLAIARIISRNPRIYWTATLVFTLTNWVNQNYYSPQAFSFTLYLTMCLIALTFLRSTPAKWVSAVEQRLKKRSRRPSAEERVAPPGRALRSAAIIGILILQVVIVVSHQLTPYLAVLGLFPLFVLGYLRPKWLGPALLAIVLGYLLPNFDYVQEKYGLFTGFNVFANASYNAPRAEAVTEAGRFVAHGAEILSLLAGALGIAGCVRRLLQGKIRATLIVGWLSVAPLLGLLGQSYGGEARFRVYLFALPWLAIGVAWLFWSGPVRTRKTVIGASASLTVMALLFTAVYFQPEADYRVSKDDVVAGKWLDARVVPGDLVFETNYFFPLLIGPKYPLYLQWGRINSLLEYLKDAPGSVRVQDLKEYANTVRRSDRIYLVFSDRQQGHAVAHKLFEADLLPKLEEALSNDSTAINVFKNGSVRIYQIAGKS